LRFLVAFLLAANLAFFAWSRGLLDVIPGVSSMGDREPGRLLREQRPEAVKVAPASAAQGPADGTACLESGPYAPGEVSSAEVAISSMVPPGLWANLRQERAGQWVVYLGPFADKESLAPKEAELKRTKVSFEVIKEKGDLDYGFVLGRFNRLSEASATLEQLSPQAVLRKAHVVNLVQPATVHVLRIEAASSALGRRLAGLNVSAVKPFVACLRS